MGQKELFLLSSWTHGNKYLYNHKLYLKHIVSLKIFIPFEKENQTLPTIVWVKPSYSF
jgi:hypothetical protein